MWAFHLSLFWNTLTRQIISVTSWDNYQLRREVLNKIFMFFSSCVFWLNQVLSHDDASSSFIFANIWNFLFHSWNHLTQSQWNAKRITFLMQWKFCRNVFVARNDKNSVLRWWNFIYFSYFNIAKNVFPQIPVAATLLSLPFLSYRTHIFHSYTRTVVPKAKFVMKTCEAKENSTLEGVCYLKVIALETSLLSNV